VLAGHVGADHLKIAGAAPADRKTRHVEANDPASLGVGDLESDL
jgi:hypothetical protein